MKRLFIILVCFLLLGCVSSKSFESLERKVADLESEKMMEEAAGVGATMRIRGFYGLTSADSGGGLNLADKSTTSAEDQDLALGRVIDDTDPTETGYFAAYYFDSSSTATQSLPRIVVPTDSPTTGRWIMVTRLYAQEFRADVDDGEHMFNVSNSDDPTYTPIEDWDMVVNRTEEWFGYYDVTDAEWVKFKHGKTYNIAATTTTPVTIPYSVHWGGIVTNEGQSAVPATYNLQAAEKDMEMTFYMLVAQPININPDDADKFIQVGETYTNGQTMNLISTGIGKYVTIKAVENGSGNYDWATEPDNEAYWAAGS